MSEKASGSQASASAVIARARASIAEGRRDEAHDLLLDEGFVKRLEPPVQQAFADLVPVNETLRKLLETDYADLESDSADVRFKALTRLARELSREVPRDGVRWMRDPRASGPLIEAAGDADPKVAARAVIVLVHLVSRYFQDRRTLPVFLQKLRDPKQDTRIRAISGIGCLAREADLVHLVGFIEHGTDAERAEVARQIWGLSFATVHHLPPHLYPIQWSADGRRLWRGKMIEALKDPAADVRKFAARALNKLGDDDSLKPLKMARQVEQDADAAFYLDETIAALEAPA